MFASPSLLVLVLAAATALADSDPYSKFGSDANALLAAPTGTAAAQLDAIYSWQLTQTAVPSADLESQYQDYLNAYMSAASVPLPAWVTAIPSSLQPVMTSFLQAEATLVRQDIAPLVSQFEEDVSAYSATAQATPAPTSSSSSNATVVSASASTMVTASSGFAQVSANASAARVSSGMMPSANSTGSPLTTSNGTAGAAAPTNSVTPPTVTKPQTVPKGGADRPAGMAGLAAVVGVLGMMVLL